MQNSLPIFSIVIDGHKLQPGERNKKSKSFSREKSVFFNGTYYAFPRNYEYYPLELAVAQIDSLSKFDLVFFEDIKNECFVGVFVKNSRNTLIIEKSKFIIHLNRYKESIEKIAIVNNVLENIDLSKMENVDFIALEKLPELLDPNKKKVIFVKYSLFTMFFIFTMIVINFFNSELNQSLSINKQNLQNEMITTQKLMKEINVSPSLPNKNIRVSQLEKILNEIEVGQK